MTQTTTSRPGPPRSRQLREAVAAADAVIFATPEYNSSIPGALKNALDWASRPFATNSFRNKPVAVIGLERRCLRRHLGPGRAPQGARRDGRARRRGRGRGGTRGREVHPDGELVDPVVRQQLRDALQAVLAEVATDARSRRVILSRARDRAAARLRRAAAARRSARAPRRGVRRRRPGTRSRSSSSSSAKAWSSGISQAIV